jgi:tetratricopeptide (TPR) repeat protein
MPASRAGASRRRLTLRHTYRRFRHLTAFGQVAVVLAMTLAGAGVTEAARRALERGGDPRLLRAEVQRRLIAEDYVGARRALSALAASCPNGLGPGDSLAFEPTLRDGLARLERDYRQELEDHRVAHRYDAALETLRAMKAADLAPDWVAFTQGEVLRSAGRPREAIDAYVHCADAFPTSSLADDALYWAGVLEVTMDRPRAGVALWRRLIATYPSSALRGAAERALTQAAR